MTNTYLSAFSEHRVSAKQPTDRPGREELVLQYCVSIPYKDTTKTRQHALPIETIHDRGGGFSLVLARVRVTRIDDD